MTTRVTLHSLPDGQVVVEKQAVANVRGRDTSIRAEAEWLAMARHSGVVQLIEIGDEPFTITTAHAGSMTLRTARPDPQTAARLLANAAKTLAELHERELVHGQLTLDHIIVSGDNRTTLCSPDGIITDPLADLRALGEIVSELLEQWRSEGVELPTEAQWQSLTERLGSEDSNLTARRVHLAFGRLDPKADTAAPERPKLRAARRSLKTRRPSGQTLVGAFMVLAVAGAMTSWLTLLRSTTPNTVNSVGAELVVDGNVFRVGNEGDVVLAVPSRCGGQPEAVLLDTNSVVWIFDQAADQQTAEALARIPGATNLIGESDAGCGRIWVTGPAGQSLVVGSD